MELGSEFAPQDGYDDAYLHLRDWRRNVLERSDRVTLDLLGAEIRARIEVLEARDRELSFHPPSLVRDRRRRVRRELELERMQLELVETASKS